MRRQYDGLLALLVHYGCSQRGTVTCDRLGPVVLAQYGINPHANNLFAIGAATLLMNPVRICGSVFKNSNGIAENWTILTAP
jgi:hypothetical protein